MINYILDSQVNGLVGVSEDRKISIYSSEYPNIDYMFIVKEDGELDYYGQKYDVEVGDIILKLYSRGIDYSQREIVIIPAKQAKQWVENITERKRNEKNDAVMKCCDSPSQEISVSEA